MTTFAADLPAIPAPPPAPLATAADAHAAEVQLLRSIIESQREVMCRVYAEVRGPSRPYSTDSYLPEHLVDQVKGSIDIAELAR